MKKIITVAFVMLAILSSCNTNCDKNNANSGQEIDTQSEDSGLMDKPVEDMTPEELDEFLKDVPFPGGNGDYLIMRSDDQNPPDTIVDGIGYAHV